jgi:hypothetical protein
MSVEFKNWSDIANDQQVQLVLNQPQLARKTIHLLAYAGDASSPLRYLLELLQWKASEEDFAARFAFETNRRDEIGSLPGLPLSIMPSAILTVFRVNHVLDRYLTDLLELLRSHYPDCSHVLVFLADTGPLSPRLRRALENSRVLQSAPTIKFTAVENLPPVRQP